MTIYNKIQYIEYNLIYNSIAYIIMQRALIFILLIILCIGCSSKNKDEEIKCYKLKKNNFFFLKKRFSVYSFVDSTTNSICDEKYSNFIESKIKELNTAFEKVDTNMLKKFMNEWYIYSVQKRKHNLNESYLNKIATNFLQIIFNPDTIPVVKWEDELMYVDSFHFKTFKYQIQGNFAKANYVIINDRINICICKDSIYNEKAFDFAMWSKYNLLLDTIINFYPVVYYKNKKILYLTKEYYNILNKFFHCPNDNWRKNHLNLLLKREFLKPEIESSIRHSQLDLQYETFPKIEILVLNESLNKGIVNIRTKWNAGGYAEFEKANDTWKLIKLDLDNWIE